MCSYRRAHRLCQEVAKSLFFLKVPYVLSWTHTSQKRLQVSNDQIQMSTLIG